MAEPSRIMSTRWSKQGMSIRTILLSGLVLAFVGGTQVAAQTTATASMKARDGKDLGLVKIVETTAGLLLTVKLRGLPPGAHGFHVYEAGKCEGDFTTAGTIYNPLGARHGFLSEEGPMAGDLPNLIVPANGEVDLELLSPFLSLSKQTDESLLDGDGAAIVIRERADDYRSDPEGETGSRIACGVIAASK